jgi:hypothetical protein
VGVAKSLRQIQVGCIGPSTPRQARTLNACETRKHAHKHRCLPARAKRTCKAQSLQTSLSSMGRYRASESTVSVSSETQRSPATAAPTPHHAYLSNHHTPRAHSLATARATTEHDIIKLRPLPSGRQFTLSAVAQACWLSNCCMHANCCTNCRANCPRVLMHDEGRVSRLKESRRAHQPCSLAAAQASQPPPTRRFCGRALPSPCAVSLSAASPVPRAWLAAP